MWGLRGGGAAERAVSVATGVIVVVAGSFEIKQNAASENLQQSRRSDNILSSGQKVFVPRDGHVETLLFLLAIWKHCRL